MTGSITYSPALTLVPTYECFNRCTYCNFRVDPGRDSWLSLGAARQQLQRGVGAIEALILSGEVHPGSDRRRAWVERLYQLAVLALEMGLLPHTNAGPLSREEMAYLAEVNVSMGLMVEQVRPNLGVHRHAPSKDPALRLAQLDQAGGLGIPFTTGILLGIGETAADWRQSLTAIARCHHHWGHIQEVIIQPYQPGQRDGHGGGVSVDQVLAAIALARSVLPEAITIQVPPNLLQPEALLLGAIAQGARDLGGIGPIDEVNPDHAHPPLATLASTLSGAGWSLVPRLPVYPAYDPWLPPALKAAVTPWRQWLSRPGPGAEVIQALLNDGV